jgi:hypothetical protein
MEHEEIMKFLHREYKNKGFSRKSWEEKAGVNAGNVTEVLRGRKGTMGLYHIMRLLDALDFRLVIEDKNIDWGTDMNKLRLLPKKLYHGERIEARETIKSEGFWGRVDLFETAEIALKFIPTPCDIYEIHPAELKRKSFELVEHPYGDIYSYFSNIPTKFIKNRVTYR